MKECFGKSIVACILSVCAFGQLTGWEDYPAGYGLRTTCENGICEPQACSESQECGGDLECRGGICRAHVELGVSLNGKPEVHESSDSTASFDITLPAKPTAPVTVYITVSDDSEIGVSVVEITIDPEDWDKPITVTIAAMDDPIADGTQSAQINLTTTSADPNFNGLTGATAVYSILDDEQPGVVLAATTTELLPGSYSTTVTAVLSYEPTEPVTVTLTTSDANLAKPETVTLRHWRRRLVWRLCRR